MSLFFHVFKILQFIATILQFFINLTQNWITYFFNQILHNDQTIDLIKKLYILFQKNLFKITFFFSFLSTTVLDQTVSYHDTGHIKFSAMHNLYFFLTPFSSSTLPVQSNLP